MIAQPISRVANYFDECSLYIETFAVRIPNSYGSHMFRIIIRTEKGFPCGYNYNCHLQMWSNGWIEVTDNKEAGITYNSDYHADPEEKQLMSEETADAFKEYIEKIIEFL